MIVYGGLSGDSIGALLIAGTSPGIVLTITISGAVILIAKMKPAWIAHAPVAGVTWRQRFATLPSFWPVVVIAAVVFGGIFGGVFSPTEAGAVASFIMFIVLFIIKRRASLEVLKTSLLDTAGISAMIMFIFGSATVFSHLLVMTGVSGWIIDGIIGLNLSNLSLVIVIAVMYIAMGCFLDGISMICITVPIFTPVITALGIDTLWYAMVVILAMHVGLITPPVGLDVYAAKGVAEPDVSIEDIFAGALPFFLATLVALVIVIAFPWLSTILPSLMLGG
ncbi:C4-dicarboxylate TRAP transporter large permease protein DctM [subsurface metagenome]